LAEHPVADYVNDVTFDLDDDVMVTDVIVIAKTVRMLDGAVGVYLAQSDGVSWIEKIGMLRAAERIETGDLRREDDD
jgi:hypothetical protein